MEQILIETNRLVLRPYKSSDVDPIVSLAGDFRVSSTTLNIPYPYTSDMAKEWISTHTNEWLEGIGLIYAVTEKDTGQLLGTVSLIDIHDGKAELGYWFGFPYWGKGYCSEAVEALIEFSFTKMEITFPASGRVMIKNGMQYIGSIHQKNREGILSNVETYELKYT